MIQPERCFIITLTTGFVIQNALFRFVLITASQFSAFILINKPSRVIPALLINTSSLPKSAKTSSTAFAGDQGEIALTRANTALTHANTALDHADAKGIAVANGLYKITTNAEGHVSEANAVKKEDITNLGIPSTEALNNKVSLPTTNPNGNLGDFAISDGAGGITWQTIPLAANETF